VASANIIDVDPDTYEPEYTYSVMDVDSGEV